MNLVLEDLLAGEFEGLVSEGLSGCGVDASAYGGAGTSDATEEEGQYDRFLKR